MTTLWTSGCSYTQYCWPTWADYLGHHYDRHVQRGQCNIDCTKIGRNIYYEDIKPGDHVVIAWTGFDRFTFYNDQTGWNGGNCTGDKNFFTYYYHPYERFSTMLDMMYLIEQDSKARNYTVWHFSAFPFLTAETMTNIHNKVQEKFALLKDKFSNLLVAENLWDFREAQGTIITKHKYNDNDNHPTPQCHWDWLKQIIAPAMNISLQNLSDKVANDQQRVLNGDVTFNDIELYIEKDNAKD